MNFRIIELKDDEINNSSTDCIMAAFKYMVENIDTQTIWFGSNNYNECEKYISLHINKN